jgi:predicted nucleic acid-binding protein
MRVFLDANILFSAAQPHSRTRSLVTLLLNHAACLTNAYAVEEARRNLESKFPSALAGLPLLVQKCEITLSPDGALEIEVREKDRPILGGAVAGHATHLLTGDERDFGPHCGRTVQGVKIVSPRLLAEELVRLGWLRRATE